MSVRHHVGGGLTDVVGHLLDVTDDTVSVLRRDGTVVAFDPSTVTAGKPVPAEPVRPGWAVPQISAADLQRVCSAGWPARTTARLGDWVLREHGGVTGRANSAMAVGDPGLPLAEAVVAVEEWYAEHGLPPLMQLPLADPRNLELADLGWARRHGTVVQTAPVAPLLASLPQRADLAATVEATPSPRWRTLMHDLDANDPAAHLAILTGPAVVGFVTVLRDGEPVGIGRVSIEGEWAGITSVDVAPTERRAGIGTAVMAALVRWAAEQGAVATYLQVRVGNAAALKLYARLGYRTHHPYTYRSPASPP